MMLVGAGCAGLVVNTMVLRFLLNYLGETRVLHIGASHAHASVIPSNNLAFRMRCMKHREA
jgi:hypothetical protein